MVGAWDGMNEWMNERVGDWSLRQTWYDDAGVFGPSLHGLVRSVGHSIQVGWVLVQLPAAVRVDSLFPVDVHLFVGIDWHHHFTYEGVDTGFLKPARHTNKHRDRVEFIVAFWSMVLYFYVMSSCSIWVYLKWLENCPSINVHNRNIILIWKSQIVIITL